MFSNLKLESRLPMPSGTLSLVGPAGLSGNKSTSLEILNTDATLGALHALSSVFVAWTAWIMSSGRIYLWSTTFIAYEQE